MADKGFRIKFWGVRGSHPSPGAHTQRYGGNTTCVEFDVAGHHIIIDAGTGLINLGHEIARQNGNSQIVTTLLFTHSHHDHTQGFPFFAPFYRGTSTIFVLGPMAFQQTLQASIESSMMPPFSPVALHEMPCQMVIRNISETDYILFKSGEREPRIDNQYHPTVESGQDDVRVDVMRSYAHPKGGVLVFRVAHAGKSVVFATDVEGYVGGDRRLIEFARGAHILIHDAQYEDHEYFAPIRCTQGWGHSTWEMATDVANQAAVRHLLLTHHDPSHDDATVQSIETKARARFAPTTAAWEGMEIEVGSGWIPQL